MGRGKDQTEGMPLASIKPNFYDVAQKVREIKPELKDDEIREAFNAVQQSSAEATIDYVLNHNVVWQTVGKNNKVRKPPKASSLHPKRPASSPKTVESRDATKKNDLSIKSPFSTDIVRCQQHSTSNFDMRKSSASTGNNFKATDHKSQIDDVSPWSRIETPIKTTTTHLPPLQSQVAGVIDKASPLRFDPLTKGNQSQTKSGVHGQMHSGSLPLLRSGLAELAPANSTNTLQAGNVINCTDLEQAMRTAQNEKNIKQVVSPLVTTSKADPLPQRRPKSNFNDSQSNTVLSPHDGSIIGGSAVSALSMKPINTSLGSQELMNKNVLRAQPPPPDQMLKTHEKVNQMLTAMKAGFDTTNTNDNDRINNRGQFSNDVRQLQRELSGGMTFQLRSCSTKQNFTAQPVVFVAETAAKYQPPNRKNVDIQFGSDALLNRHSPQLTLQKRTFSVRQYEDSVKGPHSSPIKPTGPIIRAPSYDDTIAEQMSRCLVPSPSKDPLIQQRHQPLTERTDAEKVYANVSLSTASQSVVKKAHLQFTGTITTDFPPTKHKTTSTATDGADAATGSGTDEKMELAKQAFNNVADARDSILSSNKAISKPAQISIEPVPVTDISIQHRNENAQPSARRLISKESVSSIYPRPQQSGLPSDVWSADKTVQSKVANEPVQQKRPSSNPPSKYMGNIVGSIPVNRHNTNSGFDQPNSQINFKTREQPESGKYQQSQQPKFVQQIANASQYVSSQSASNEFSNQQPQASFVQDHLQQYPPVIPHQFVHGQQEMIAYPHLPNTFVQYNVPHSHQHAITSQTSSRQDNSPLAPPPGLEQHAPMQQNFTPTTQHYSQQSHQMEPWAQNMLGTQNWQPGSQSFYPMQQQPVDLQPQLGVGKDDMRIERHQHFAQQSQSMGNTTSQYHPHHQGVRDIPQEHQSQFSDGYTKQHFMPPEQYGTTVNVSQANQQGAFQTHSSSSQQPNMFSNAVAQGGKALQHTAAPQQYQNYNNTMHQFTQFPGTNMFLPQGARQNLLPPPNGFIPSQFNGPMIPNFVGMMHHPVAQFPVASNNPQFVPMMDGRSLDMKRLPFDNAPPNW